MSKKRIASLDYGKKRIGVALSDENQIIASSLGVIQAGKNHAETIQRILDLLKPYLLEQIVVGNPIHLNGSVGEIAEEVKVFIALLQQQTELEITLVDERLTSIQAERALIEGGMRRKKRAKVIDAVAAVLILQTFLGH
ncbi:MAG: putative pre-16S rRNA nuclease [Chlamydiales bacterium]|nr:putative pre-16S rRNA nuclease [Chlamydiales bacterium]